MKHSSDGKSAASLDPDSIWLVKSSDKILGPFKTTEVEAKLRSKEIVIIDEIVSPMSRWRVIRDEARFRDVVEEVRRGQMTMREDTEVQASTSTGTATATETVNDSHSGSTSTDVTATPISSDGRHPHDASRVLDAEFTDSDDMPRGPRSTGRPAMRQYGISYSATERMEKSNAVKVAWIIAGITVAVAALVLISSQFSGPKDKAGIPQSYDRLLIEGNNAWLQGEWFSALNFYRNADFARPNRPEVVSRYAPLLIQLEGATANARRSLTETLKGLPNNADRSLRAELENGLGLAALNSEDFQEAETHYRSARALVPNSVPARFGLAMTAFLKRSFNEAYDGFSKIEDSAPAALMAARALISLDRPNRVANRKNALAIISKTVSRWHDFRFEGFIISAAIDAESGNKDAAKMKVRAALDTDPEMTNDHRHDPLLYLEPLSLRRLLDTCQTVSKVLNTPIAHALYGLCLFKAHDREEAGTVVSRTIGAAPEDPMVQSVDAFISAASGRSEDARAALRLAMKSEVPRLALIVQARVCAREGEAECAENTWSELSRLDPPVLAAITALADIAARKGNSGRAQDLRDRAKAISPNYKPALALKDGSER